MLSHYEHANGKSPLTNEERNTMLNLMASQSPASGTNNALVSPIAPGLPLADISYTQEEIEALMRLQEEQTHRLHDVKSVLEHHSPSGIIPSLDNAAYFNGTESSDINNPNLDLDQFLDTGAFYSGSSPLGNADFDYGNFDSGMCDSHFDVGMDGTDERPRIVETQENSEAATPDEGNSEMGIRGSGSSNGMRSPIKKRRKN